MEKLYDRIDFTNNTTPALNDTNMNAMSKAIDDIDDRVIDIAGTVMETVPELQGMIEDVEELSQNPPYIGANGDWYIWDTSTGAYVDSGIDASITVSIADVTMLEPSATPYVTNTGTDTDPIFHLFIPRGQTGAAGATGATPDITMTASADGTSSASPSVQVTKGGTAASPTFALAFSGIKGAKGDTGNTGATGQDGADGFSPAVTITPITGGHRVNITDEDHPSGQNFDVMDGTGGDMNSSTYDPNGTVATAGGIVAYVNDVITDALTASY